MALKFGEVVGRIFLGCKDSPEDRTKKRGCPDVERNSHSGGNFSRNRGGAHVKKVGKQVRQCRRKYRAESDEQALHGKASSALKVGEQVGDERAKGLHADVDAGIENP